MDFRELVAELEACGELLHIDREVDPEYELPALLVQAEERGQACRFARVTGSDFPAAGGVMTSVRRWARGLGQPVDAFDTPNALEAFVAGAVAAPLAPIRRDAGPVSEVVVSGADADTAALPAPLFFSGDSHRFITAGLGFAIDPATGTQNVGFYRVPVIGPRTICLSSGPTSDMRRIYNVHRERGTKMQVALAIGAPPALQIAAAADIPAGIPDIDVAGALQRAPLELVKCRTSDIMVPANAEFIIEATVQLDEWIDNTMGEFGDLYGTTSSPVATIDALTYRREPLFHIIMAGMHREHNQLGGMLGYNLRATILDRLAARNQRVRDVSVDLTPRRTGLRAQVTVSIDKTSDDQPREVIGEIFAMRIGRFPMSLLLQRVVVVDTDVDIYDHRDIEWSIASRMVNASQFSIHEDRSGRGAAVTRLGFDATAPLDRRIELRRPEIPGGERYELDRYLSDS